MFTPKSDIPAYLNPALTPKELLKYLIFDPATRTVTRNWAKRSRYVSEVAPGVFKIVNRYFTAEQLLRYMENPTETPPNQKHPINPTLSGNMNSALPPKQK